MEVNMTMVDVTMRKTDARVRYFWYLVALLCIMDSVDFADPVRTKAMFN